MFTKRKQNEIREIFKKEPNKIKCLNCKIDVLKEAKEDDLYSCKCGMDINFMTGTIEKRFNNYEDKYQYTVVWDFVDENGRFVDDFFEANSFIIGISNDAFEFYLDELPPFSISKAKVELFLNKDNFILIEKENSIKHIFKDWPAHTKCPGCPKQIYSCRRDAAFRRYFCSCGISIDTRFPVITKWIDRQKDIYLEWHFFHNDDKKENYNYISTTLLNLDKTHKFIDKLIPFTGKSEEVDKYLVLL